METNSAFSRFRVLGGVTAPLPGAIFYFPAAFCECFLPTVSLSLHSISEYQNTAQISFCMTSQNQGGSFNMTPRTLGPLAVQRSAARLVRGRLAHDRITHFPYCTDSCDYLVRVFAWWQYSVSIHKEKPSFIKSEKEMVEVMVYKGQGNLWLMWNGKVIEKKEEEKTKACRRQCNEVSNAWQPLCAAQVRK